MLNITFYIDVNTIIISMVWKIPQEYPFHLSEYSHANYSIINATAWVSCNSYMQIGYICYGFSHLYVALITMSLHTKLNINYVDLALSTTFIVCACSACCQGTVFDRMPAEFGKQFGVFYPCAECCGNKLYPPNPNKICCDETIQVGELRGLGLPSDWHILIVFHAFVQQNI